MAFKPVMKTSLITTHSVEPFFNSSRLYECVHKKHFISYINNQVKVTSKVNGQIILSIPEQINEDEDEEIVNFAASNSGYENHIAIAYRSGLIRLYQWNLIEEDKQNVNSIGIANDTKTKCKVKMIKSWKSSHVGPIVLMRFDPNGSNLLATGGGDGNVIIWDLVGQYVTHFLKGCKGIISLIEFERDPADDKYLIAIAGSHDNKVHVWDLHESTLIATFEDHCSEVTDACFFKQSNHFSTESNSDELFLFTASRDRIAIVWSVLQKKSVRTIPIYDSMSSCLLIPKNMALPFLRKEMVKGRLFVVAGENGMLSFWDTITGVCQAKVRVYHQPGESQPAENNQDENNVRSRHMVKQFLFDESTSQLTVVTHEFNILVFDLLNIKLIRTYTGYNDEILDLRLFGQDQSYVAVATNSSALKLFDIKSTTCTVVNAHQDIIIGLQSFNSNVDLLASCSKDKSFKIWRWDADQLKLYCLFQGIGHESSVTALGVPCLTHNWIISGSEDNMIKVWSIPDISDVEQLEYYDHHHLISQSTIKAHDDLINCIAVAPNDRLIATCSSDKLCKIWKFDADTCVVSLLGTLSGHRRAVWCVAFSPVDQVVASSSADSSIKLWSIADYSCLRSFQGHECSVFKLLFATRGMQLISSGSDGNIIIWNVKDAESVATIDAHDDKIYALALSSNEQTLISGSFDSQIKIWKDDTLDKAEQVRKSTEQQLEAQSVLKNLLFKRKWKKAIKFSLLLNQPFTTLKIFKEIMFDLPEQKERESTFEDLLRKLNEEQMSVIMNYSVHWNTNHRHCEATQLILQSAIRVYGEKLFKLPNAMEFVQKLQPYLKKHFQRFERLTQTVTFFDFLYSNLKLEGQNESADS